MTDTAKRGDYPLVCDRAPCSQCGGMGMIWCGSLFMACLYCAATGYEPDTGQPPHPLEDANSQSGSGE